MHATTSASTIVLPSVVAAFIIPTTPVLFAKRIYELLDTFSDSVHIWQADFHDDCDYRWANGEIGTFNLNQCTIKTDPDWPLSGDPDEVYLQYDGHYSVSMVGMGGVVDGKLLACHISRLDPSRVRVIIQFWAENTVNAITPATFESVAGVENLTLGDLRDIRDTLARMTNRDYFEPLRVLLVETVRDWAGQLWPDLEDQTPHGMKVRHHSPNPEATPPIPFDMPSTETSTPVKSESVGSESGSGYRLLKTRAELQQMGHNISEERYADWTKEAELRFSVRPEGTPTYEQIAQSLRCSTDKVKKDFAEMRKYGCIESP